MNYYAARQRKSDMLWHYTCMNDDLIWPVGACADGCPGHATADEAREHQKQFLLDNARYFDVSGWPKHKCSVDGCEQEATRAAETPGHFWHHHVFCAEHCTREELAKLVHVGESASSY